MRFSKVPENFYCQFFSKDQIAWRFFTLGTWHVRLPILWYNSLFFSDFQSSINANKTPTKPEGKECKEDIFGRYIASELKRIKSKKTYEEVKWKILQALQAAAEKETDDSEPSVP